MNPVPLDVDRRVTSNASRPLSSLAHAWAALLFTPLEEGTLDAIHAIAAETSVVARNGAWFLTDPIGDSSAR